VRLCALDLATTVGWCIGVPTSAPIYGSVLLDGRERAARYGALLDWLDDALTVHRFDAVLCEAPMVSNDIRSRNAALLSLGLAAIVEFWCWDNSIRRLEPAHVGTVRKDILGRGTFAKGLAKPAALDWCRSQGFAPGDDNAADSIVLWAHGTGWHRHRR